MENEKADLQKHEQENDSLEKGIPPDAVQNSNPEYHFDVHDLDRVQRRLKQRHVQMIAIAGTIGTGLFLGSGGALSTAGPLGALLAYALVGTVAYSSLCAVGEMSTWAPISGTFPHFAARWVDPALGFATGWNYFYTNAISTPVEITAAVILLTFWDKDAPTSHITAYTLVICILVCLINIFGVRYFGESEFIFAIIKLVLIIGLLLTGLIIDLGGGPNKDRIGFRFWKNPGAVARLGLEPNHIGWDRFLAILGVLVQAAFSFQGMELVVIAASETESPRRNIAKAVRRVFWRILVFYILGILMIGMLVAYNDTELLQLAGVDTAASSPFVIAINRAGIKVLPHIVNAAIFTSAFSAGNSFLFCSSRVLYGLALRGQAPKFLTYCTKKGLPLFAVLVSSAFTLLSFMSVSAGADRVFTWFVNLSTTGGFTSWFVMNVTYLRFRKGMLVQGFDLKKNSYHNRFQPYISYWGAGWTLFFILINGFQVFWSFNASDFFTAYVNIPIFVVLYLGFKFTKRTSFWKPREMDFVTGIPTPEETEEPEEPPKNFGERIANIVF
ncbi:general amino acid permease 1 [Pholiota conissans]|uniref:General amino acid permease 1 n=1 Tax=Pholiota conissans TaxID=109636 RepID=A0A9P5YRI2_9AGAR|nr:general amino acid permease 1 [Pholiota conissans]